MAQSLYLLLGSNVGNRHQNICRALDIIVTRLGKITRKSAIYSSLPWGNKEQKDFLNMAVVVSTEIEAIEALRVCKQIEKELGRATTEKWQAREIDIDLIYLDDQIIETDKLSIPHKALPIRRFALLPLVEIAPDYIHPIIKLSNKNLLQLCIDTGEVAKWCNEK